MVWLEVRILSGPPLECAVHPKAYSQCSFVGSAPVDRHRLVAGLPGSGISSANSGGSPHDAIAPASRAGWSSLPSRSMETTIQLQEEQAITVRELDPTADLALKHD